MTLLINEVVVCSDRRGEGAPASHRRSRRTPRINHSTIVRT